MPTAADVAWVDVLPSMKNFLPQLRQQANSSARTAGGSAGRSFGEAFGDSAKASVEAAQGKLAAAQKKAADASGALTVAQARLDDIRKKSSVAAGTLAAAEERVAKAQRTVELQAAGVARAENEVAVASAYASRESNNLGSNLQKQSVIGKAFGGTMSALGTVVRRAWLPVSAVVGGAGVVGIRTAANLEQARIAFTNMLGSAQAADAFLRRLAAFAAKTPFEFQDVTQAAQKLMAMGVAADDVLPYLTAIGDAVSAMGGGKEQIDRVTLAIGQMIAKGRVQSQELLQLTEAGIPALQILAAQYGVSTAQMQEMVTAGHVLSADAIPKLIDGLENGTAATQAFGGMMDQQSKSLVGLWSTAKDTVKADLALAFTPLIPALKAALSGGTDLVGDFLNRFQSWSTTVIAQFPHLVSAIAAQDAQGVGEVIDNILGNTGRYVGTFRSIAAGVFPVVDQLWQLFTNLRGIAGDLGPVLGTVLGGGLRLAWDALNLVLPVLVDVTGWLADNKPVVIALASAWAALTLATKAHAAALTVAAAGGMVEWIKQGRIIQAVTKAWAAVQWVLNAALEANPIVLVVTGLVALGAALYAAWTHSETFRKIVTGALSAVADAGIWMWEHVLRPTWDALVTAWNAISDAVQWAWTRVIQPTWDAIAAAATWLWDNILSPVISGITAAWNALATAIAWAWTNIIQPVWDVIATAATVLYRILVVVVFGAIVLAWELLVTTIKTLWEHVLQPTWEAVATAATWLWTNVLQPVWAAMQVAWDALLTAIQWAWTNILQPTWQAIETAANWLWSNVLQPIWAATEAGWSALVTAIQWAWDNILHPVWQAIETAANWLWNNVLSPIWDAIGAAWDGLMNGMRAVYDNVIHPMWTIITDAINALKGVFDTVVAGIKATWDTIMDILATPINFVIEIIFNKGLFTAWNWVVEHLGLPDSWKAPHWNQLDHGLHFAEGGTIPGQSPTPTADNIPIWATAGEFMQPVPAVDFYGVDAMEAVRQRKASIMYAKGGQIGAIPGYATGGQLFDAVHAQFPTTRFTSGYRPGARDYHGKNMAADIAGPSPTPDGSQLLASIEQWIATKYGKGTTELIYDGIGNKQADLRLGIPHEYNAATKAQHHNHVHWAMAGALAAAAGGAQAGTGSEAPWYEQLWGSVTGAFNWFTDKIGAVGQMIQRFGDNPIVNIVKQVPVSLLGMLWDTVKDKVAALFSSGIGVDNSSSKSAVQSIAKTFGWGEGAQWNAIDYIVQHESSWNSSAQNPSSTASGLFQLVDGTWRAYRHNSASQYKHAKDAPAFEQANAGLGYIQARYGTPTAAQAFWRSHHWYGKGGLIPPMLLDTGGLWPDGTLGMNASGGDERVLTPGQDDYWTRWVDVADRVVDTGGGRRSLIERVEITVKDNETAFQALDELDHRLRVADLGGRYAWTDAP